MNALLGIALLALPFLIVGAIVTALTILVGKATPRK
jgi:hypothetical protein